MAKKSYRNDADHHAGQVKYYYDHAGANGHSQAIHHYNEFGKRYEKSAGNRAGEAVVIKSMYDEAGRLMKIMKRREEGKPDEEPPVKE